MEEKNHTRQTVAYTLVDLTEEVSLLSRRPAGRFAVHELTDLDFGQFWSTFDLMVDQHFIAKE